MRAAWVSMWRNPARTNQKYRFTVGENATVRGMVIINAGNQKTYSKGTEIELNIEKNAKIRMGNVQVNAINGGSVTSTNQGWIQGEYMGCADGADSTADLTNLEGGQIAALDIFARGENAQMTAKNEGSAASFWPTRWRAARPPRPTTATFPCAQAAGQRAKAHRSPSPTTASPAR